MGIRLVSAVAAISTIVIIGGIILVSNVVFSLSADEHVRKVDRYILDLTGDEPGLGIRISELHVCPNLQMYGHVL